jgi:SNF2 family DNA or RNA helicase
MTVEEIKLITETKKGRRIGHPATVRYIDGRIEFLVSPFGLKDEIKAMKGSKWHGYDKPEPRKIWSIEDCPRNRFQLSFLKGENPYEWFDRELVVGNYQPRILEGGKAVSLMTHQGDLADHGLTYHFQIWAAEMGVGKTLSAITVMENSGVKEWYWVGPKSALKAIQREFKKWKFDPTIKVTLLTYDALARLMNEWPKGQKPPMGVIFDESSRLKTATSQRTRAAQMLADLIRAEYGFDGYVILMSGTPSPKSPVDWWAQAEIAFPGFLKEGSPKALEQRLAFLVLEEFDSGSFNKRQGWKDDCLKCDKCGKFEEDHAQAYNEDTGEIANPEDIHDFKPSENEVALMHERLQGLVVVKHKKDCLDLPDKMYRTIVCKPSKSTLRVAQALVDSAENAVGGMTLLRELSDGFQYRQQEDGMSPCEHCHRTGLVAEWIDPDDEEKTYSNVDMMDADVVARLEKIEVCCPACDGNKEVKKYIRITREIPCPKEPAIHQLLEENEEQGRLVIFAGFTGSVDRCVNLCLAKKWDVVRCDGRGFCVFKVQSDGKIEQMPREDGLEYWANLDNARVAFVSHPESGGMGLTLTEASMIVFYSNSFKPEYRVQAEDRIHRPGIDLNKGATIVDLIHLPSDQRCLDVIRANRKLELMSMGELRETLMDESCVGDGELVEV